MAETQAKNDIFSGKNLLIIILSLIVIGLSGFVFLGKSSSPQIGSQSDQNAVTKEKAGEIALSFINDSILQGGGKASLVGVEEENNLYKFKLNINNQEISSYITKDGKIIFPQAIDIEEAKKETKTEQGQQVATSGSTIGDFTITKEQICKEDDKPIIYFFGSNSCPHCNWEHPIVQKVADSFGNFISFHDNMDSDKDGDVFFKYNPDGGIPTLIIGCKYYRIGSGENSGEETEVNNLTALICKMTNNQPSAVCDKVKDLISQVNE